MAEGLLRNMAGDRFEVFSAGTEPAGVNPLAVKAMAEIGVDISHHHSKHAKEYLGQGFPFLVTLCDDANEHCPIFPGVVYRYHWGFEDPAAATGTEEERLAAFRKVRDEIKAQIESFVSGPANFRAMKARRAAAPA
jgi:arsenate reductase